MESRNYIKLKFKILSENATTSKRSSPFAAGTDLYTAETIHVPPQNRCIVQTDIALSLPKGCYGRIAPRSGLAVNNFIDIGGGVIDCDYTGNIGVILFNHSSETFQVNKVDRVAQLIVGKIHHPVFVEVDGIDETERGSNGFGSTRK